MHILFDLDGTMTDSFMAIKVTVARTLEDLGAAATTDDHLRSLVGAPLHEVFRHVLGASRPELADDAVARYRVLFDEIGMPHVHLFPGMADSLERLRVRGHTMDLVTARGALSAGLIVQTLGLTRYFGRVYAPDRNHQNYDKADFVKLAMTDARATPEETVMVGDRADDVRAGRVHRTFTIGVEWGNGSRDELQAAGADAIVGRVADLAAQVEFLRAAV